MSPAMERSLLIMAVGAVLAVPSVAASTGAALPYNLVLSPRPESAGSSGTVVGQFGGVPVTGTYTGTTAAGSMALNVQRVVFVEGAYVCSGAGCAFTGTVAGTRVQAATLSGLNGLGQAASAAFPDRAAWVAAVTVWANAHFRGDQAARIVSAAGSVTMSQTPNGQGSLRESGGAEGGHDGGGGGHGGM